MINKSMKDAQKIRRTIHVDAKLYEMFKACLPQGTTISEYLEWSMVELVGGCATYRTGEPGIISSPRCYLMAFWTKKPPKSAKSQEKRT